MKAEILCVGTELLLGDIVNTNAPYIARRLAELGIDTYYQGVVGDNRERLKERLAEALDRSDIVLLTGGLGPTYDDITKEVTAECFKLPLELDKPTEKRIHEMLDAIHIRFTDNNTKQAMIPKGACILENRNGTAPGIVIEKDKKTVVLLPGPPSELEPMVDNQVVPFLSKYQSGTIRSHTVRIFGLGEARIESILREEMESGRNPTIAPYAKGGEVELRITASGATEAECEERIRPVLNSLKERFADNLYGTDVPNLQTALVEQLKKRGLKIATAESCTGGMISEWITQVSGASDVFDCGICSYANGIKESLLGVKSETLREYGAVSEQTAREMAEGIRKASGADIGISTTGLAGPTGGTPEKPVGTVFVGIAEAEGTRILDLHLARKGDDAREWIRRMTTMNALFEALKTVTKGQFER